MRAVVQRVKRAKVVVDDKTVGEIGRGHLIFLGVEVGDTRDDMVYLADKILNLRIFEDENQKLNLSVMDVQGSILVVSQFTLCADSRKGRRPSFVKAAPPEQAREFYQDFIQYLKHKGSKTASGIFQADMEVELVNDGPVTILLDSRKIF